MKKTIQQFIRFFNKSFFKNNLPEKISIYFHDIHDDELVAIRNIILFFQSMNYQFVTTDTFNSLLHSDKKLISLTFDDGFKSWLRLIPLFNEYNIKATFFTNSIFLTDDNLTRYLKNINIDSQERLISVEGIIKLAYDNHEIGAHTHSHFTLSSLSFEDFQKEDQENRKHLEKLAEVKNFAVPYGMRRYITKDQQKYLEEQYDSISYGEPGMQFNHKTKFIQRHPWLINKSFYYNIENICSNTSYFNKLTLRSGLG